MIYNTHRGRIIYQEELKCSNSREHTETLRAKFPDADAAVMAARSNGGFSDPGHTRNNRHRVSTCIGNICKMQYIFETMEE